MIAPFAVLRIFSSSTRNVSRRNVKHRNKFLFPPFCVNVLEIVEILYIRKPTMKASDESKSLSLTVTKINFIANIKGNRKFVKMRKKLPYFRQIIVRTFLVPLKLTQISLKQLTKNKKKTKKEKKRGKVTWPLVSSSTPLHLQ